MPIKKIISLHPKLAAILDGLFSLALMWWITKITSPWLLILWFFFRIGWWVALVQCMYYPPFISRLKHLVALTIFNAGLLSFLVFIDWKVAWYLVAGLFIAVPVLSFWFVPERADELTVLAKPHRRSRFLMSVLGVAGLWSGAEALIVLQIVSQSVAWFVIIFASVATVAISAWWWREYGLEYDKNFLMSGAVLLLVIFELAFLTVLLPLGYLMSSLFITWVWYIVWLVFRFTLSKEGINWKRQRNFLLVNAIILGIFLGAIARWK